MRTFEKTCSTRDVVPLLVVEIGPELQGLVHLPQISKHVLRSTVSTIQGLTPVAPTHPTKRRIAEWQEVR